MSNRDSLFGAPTTSDFIIEDRSEMDAIKRTHDAFMKREAVRVAKWEKEFGTSYTMAPIGETTANWLTPEQREKKVVLVERIDELKDEERPDPVEPITDKLAWARAEEAKRAKLGVAVTDEEVAAALERIKDRY